MSDLHVLYVCTANICRSPYMELLSRHRLAEQEGASVTFASAGTHGFVDKQMNRVMAATLEAGIPHRQFRSRHLDRDMIDSADLVLTAERSHRQFVLEEHPSAFRKVYTLGQFAEVVRRSAPTLSGRELIAAASQISGITQLKADIPDPFSRGTEAADVCAAQIGELLDVVLPALTR